MKKWNHRIRRFICGLMTGVMLFGSGLIVNAAPSNTPATIDENEKGQITIIKTVDASGTEIAANGLLGDYAANVPIEGIDFMYQKIADIENYNSNGVIGTYYTNVDTRFLEELSKENITLAADRTVGTKKYYKAQTLETALAALNRNQSETEQYILKNGKAMGKTDANGKIVCSNLSLGLYLIVETDVSSARISNGYLTGDDTYLKVVKNGIGSASTDMTKVLADGQDGNLYADSTDRGRISISSKVTPYFISVPMTNTAEVDGHAPGTVWLYDIVSYPKNTVTDITKKIVDEDDGDTLRDYEDYEIGQTIHQVIFAGASALREGKKHEKFVIKDDMTDGLTFVQITGLTYGKRTKDPVRKSDFAGYTALSSSDYRVKSDEHSFIITLTETGLMKLDKLKEDSLVVVSFDAVLNDKAKIGTERQNMNQPGLIWKNSFESEEEVKGNKVYVFTYEIDVTKSGLADPTKAGFQVYRTSAGNRTGSPMQFIKDAEGEYHVFNSKSDSANSVVKVIHPNKSGKIYVKGVDSDQYQIVEVQTEKGMNLLKSYFDIILTAPEKGTASLQNPVETTHRDGTVKGVLAVKNGSDKITSNLNVQKGKVNVSVENYEGVTLHAGGSGVFFYYAAAVLLLGIAAYVTVYASKNNKRIENESK